MVRRSRSAPAAGRQLRRGKRRHAYTYNALLYNLEENKSRPSLVFVNKSVAVFCRKDVDIDLRSLKRSSFASFKVFSRALRANVC